MTTSIESPLAQLIQVERENNPLRRFGHASPFIGKLSRLDANSLGQIARSTWSLFPPFSGKTLVVGMTESSLILGWFLAATAPVAVNLRFTTRKHRGLVGRGFREPHSHGPQHFLALNAGENFEQIVIIEDELTTGATLRNLILAVRDVTNRVVVVTLRDQRSSDLRFQLNAEMDDLGVELQVLDLSCALPHSPSTEEIVFSRVDFNPFQRSETQIAAAQNRLKELQRQHEPGAIYVVGECVDLALHWWADFAPNERPQIQHITRSPWKVDGDAIRSRADFLGDGTTSRYFLYNFEVLSPRALIIGEASTREIARQACEWLENHGVNTHSVEVSGA